MSIGALDAALSGLRVSQQQISNISTNIANVSTPGYTRKILPLSSQAVNGITTGVNAETIIRNVDLNLQRDLWTQVSQTELLDVKETYMNRIQQFHGPPDKELSIAAELGRLHDSFAALADSPEDPFKRLNTINQAEATAEKINNFSRLITQLRNDAQEEMRTVVTRVNDLLSQVSDFNRQIREHLAVGRSSATIADKRDEVVKELSGLIDITFFTRGDGVMVVQTNQGVEMVSDRVTPLTFNPTPQSATTYYPNSAAAVYVGNPATDTFSVDITARSPGGKLGGLLELRDQTFPKQMAQLDELAHKLALRFEAQGLRLFTDPSGNIPSDAPPDPTTLPNPTPVAYVGFSATIQVNDLVLANHALLQQGTYGASLSTGSNEVIRRVMEYAFGDVDFQQAIGNIDLRVSANAPPNDTLQNFLGIHSENTVTGTRNLGNFLAPADFITAANGELDPGTDTFRITFEEPDLGLGPINVDISLGAVPDTGGNFTQDLIAYITGTVIPGLPALSQAALTSMNVQFSESLNGQLVIESQGDITLDATAVPNGMGDDGLAFLGFAEGTTEAVDPYFDVQVGNSNPVRITIHPADDETDLLAALQAVTGLGVEDITLSTDGFLRLRPGGSYTNPDFGGDIRLIAGTGSSQGAGANTVIGPGTIPNGLNIVSALFGSFGTGPLQDLSPITDVGYASQTDASATPPIPTVAFRATLLGPGADISTNIFSSLRLTDFAQKMVNEQTQEQILIQSRKADEDSLKETLQQQLLNESAVNIDEELGNLIVYQNSYNAAARVITAVNQLFEELLNAVR